VSPLDLQGGYHSRANRTQRFNNAKYEEKMFGKKMKSEAISLRKGGREGKLVVVS
jgi:hypothetical protein